MKVGVDEVHSTDAMRESAPASEARCRRNTLEDDRYAYKAGGNIYTCTEVRIVCMGRVWQQDDARGALPPSDPPRLSLKLDSFSTVLLGLFYACEHIHLPQPLPQRIPGRGQGHGQGGTYQ